MISKWETLRVKIAGALIQEITVPEFGIRKVQSQPTYLVDDEKPTIYHTSDSELTGRAFTTHMVSYHLAELFKVPSLRSDIALVLSTPQSQIDVHIWRILNVQPELPRSWTAMLEASIAPSHLRTLQTSQIPLPVQASSEIQVELSSEEADDIIRFINTTCEQSESFGTPPMDDTVPASLKRLRQTSMDDEADGEITQPNIRSGFAGEFFVVPFAQSLIVDLSQTEGKSSRVFDGQLDQLSKTSCWIPTLRRRTI